MNETEGTAILRRLFSEAGLAIQERYSLEGEGVAVRLDGFDPARRVGYEYITTAEGDRAEVTPEVVAALDERMEKGDLFVLLIDEADVPNETSLAYAATHFLGLLRARGVLP